MLEETITALTAAMERNSDLLERALANRDAAPKPAAEAPAEKPKATRGRPRKEPAKPAGPKVEDVQKALVQFLGFIKPDLKEETTPAMVKERKTFARAISAELGSDKVANCDPEHYEKVIVWIEAKHRGVDVSFDADLDDLRNAQPEADDDDDDV